MGPPSPRRPPDPEQLRDVLPVFAELRGQGIEEALASLTEFIGDADLDAFPHLHRPRVALKGGTALNLFLFDVPRLSVDIDLNYVGSGDRDTMLADKPKVEQAIAAVCAREGLTVKRMPSEHAGGKWRLSFVNTAGSSDNLEVDLNAAMPTLIFPNGTSEGSRAIRPHKAAPRKSTGAHLLVAGLRPDPFAEHGSQPRDRLDEPDVS